MNVERSEIPPHTGSFEEFLQQQRLADNTIGEYLKSIERFKKWCEKEELDYEKCDYNQLLKFIQYHQSKNSNKATINIQLNTIRKYYNYLITQGKSTKNPARDLRVKQEGRKVLQDILTAEELEKVYQDYVNKPIWSFREEKQKKTHQRNTVMLGMMIYQGLQTGELRRIEKSHIHLSQGNIYISSGRRSNSRVLKLQAQQILSIQKHLEQIDGPIFLFNGNLHGIMDWLISELRKASHKIKSSGQIHSSVIVNWLKQYNIRQVQYMAGYRHISSTEKYKQEDLQDLQTQLNLFHPLK